LRKISIVSRAANRSSTSSGRPSLGAEISFWN
jgi:hypothetical protein